MIALSNNNRDNVDIVDIFDNVDNVATVATLAKWLRGYDDQTHPLCWRMDATNHDAVMMLMIMIMMKIIMMIMIMIVMMMISHLCFHTGDSFFQFTFSWEKVRVLSW